LSIGGESKNTEFYGQIDLNNNDVYGIDQIFHHGDTNTYMQFHASDQWRVVTGGGERLEVNNTNTTISNNLLLSKAINMSSAASTHPGNSTPTALSYGKLTGYGTFFINADTDGSTTEYLYLTAGYGAGSTDGMRIGHATNSLTWKGQKVWNGHNLTFALNNSQLTITTS